MCSEGYERCFTARKTSITQAPLRPNKSAAARKYDFTRRGMWELRHAARLLHTFPLCSVQKEGMMGSAVSVVGMIQRACSRHVELRPLMRQFRVFKTFKEEKKSNDLHWRRVKLSQTTIPFLARTSRKKVRFLLGLCIQRLVELEEGVVAVWCWLAAWGLGRGDHEEAISPSMSGPVGNAEIPPPLAQKTLPESAGI